MPDYRRMYYVLCAGISTVLDDIRPDSGNERIYKRLELLLNEAEDIYINTADILCLEDEKRANGRNSQKETNKK